jgi:hypothetical protein
MHMSLALIRSSILALLTSGFIVAQQHPAGDVSQDATIQALPKEVHALRIAMEQSNQIGPRIQIVLARIQLQEERVRNATRQVQDAREKAGDMQTKRTETADRIKQFEGQLVQTTDPNARKQIEFDLIEMKAAVERLSALEQQFRAKEAESNSLLIAEQGRWNEANDMLSSIERGLARQQQ